MADYRTRLIAARERLGLTHREMAARLLTPRATYEQWEADSRRTPGVAVVAAESLRRTQRRRERPANGTLYASIMDLADGSLTANEIAERVGSTRRRVATAIQYMTRRGQTRQGKPLRTRRDTGRHLPSPAR